MKIKKKKILVQKKKKNDRTIVPNNNSFLLVHVGKRFSYTVQRRFDFKLLKTQKIRLKIRPGGFVPPRALFEARGFGAIAPGAPLLSSGLLVTTRF